jgi:tetratricopeptide (TPR) repeat protein
MTDCNGFFRRNAACAIALIAATAFWTAAYGQPFENPFDNPFDTPPPKSAPSTAPDTGPTGAQPDSGIPELPGLRAPVQPPSRGPSRTTGQRPDAESAQPRARETPRQPAPGALDDNPFRDDLDQPGDAKAPPPADMPAQRDLTDFSTPPDTTEPERSPSGIDPDLETAYNELLDAGKFAEAIPLLESAAKQLPTEISDASQLDAIWSVWHRLGIAYRMTGKYDEAIKAFGAAAQAARYAGGPSAESMSRLSRGIAWFYKGEPRIAVVEFEQAASAAINDPRPEFWKGVVLASQGRYRDAITAYSSSLRLYNDYPMARNNRGLAYLAIGELDFAVADFDEVIRQLPDSASAYYKRAIALGRRGDLREAVSSYDQAIRLDPDQAPAYYNRGLVHRRLGNAQQADADLAKARQLNPQIETLTSGGTDKRSLSVALSSRTHMSSANKFVHISRGNH